MGQCEVKYVSCDFLALFYNFIFSTYVCTVYDQ